MKQLVIFLIILIGSQALPNLKPTPGSYSSVHDVLRLLPLHKIAEIEERHLKEDDGFRAAVLYLQGPEWTRLVDTVLKSEEFLKFAEMSQKFELDISQAIRCMKDHIQSLKVVPSKVVSKPNLEPFISEVQKALPLGAIARVLNTENPELKKLRNEIGRKENQKIAQALHDLPQMVRMREILKNMNLDVDPYLSLAYAFLGWFD